MAWIDGGYNVSADDQCNPNHPMNTYIIQFRPSMSTVLNQTCTLMNTGLGGTERSLSGHVQDFVGALNSTNTFQDYEELFGEPINYVLELSEEELQGFLTQLEGFWCAHPIRSTHLASPSVRLLAVTVGCRSASRCSLAAHPRHPAHTLRLPRH